MARALNGAVCTHCGERNTTRIGYNEKRKGSIWACKSCKKPFLVKTLALART